MSTLKIKPNSKLRDKLKTAQIVQFYESCVSRLAPHVSDVKELHKTWTAFAGAFKMLDDGYKWPRGSAETKKLEKLDKQRDGELKIIAHAANDLLNYSSKPDIVEAAEAIVATVRNFGGTDKAEYEGETAMISNLIDDFKKPENVEFLQTLGLTERVEDLKATNTEFQKLYELRYDAKYNHRISGSTSDLRSFTEEAFKKFCTALDGLSVLDLDGELENRVKEAIMALNATIEQFIIILNRQTGEKSKTGNDFERPDIDDPDSWAETEDGDEEQNPPSGGGGGGIIEE